MGIKMKNNTSAMDLAGGAAAQRLHDLRGERKALLATANCA